MLSNSILRRVALRAGISQQKIIVMYNAAINEAISLGKGKDDDFILEILETYAGLNEEDIINTVKNLNKKFIESNFKNFDEFIENEWNKKDEEIVSTDFNPNVRPEHNLGHTMKLVVNDEEEDEEEDEEKI